MSKKKVTKASEEQLQDLYTALKGGAPLLIALQYAGISRATYFYWVAVSCVVEQARSQEELEGMEDLFNSGISLQQIRDMSETAAANKRTGVGAFIEPSQESILQYKNNKKFRKFADWCYEIISECDKIRSKLALLHLSNIKNSVDKKNRLNASGSMWFLERTMSDFFAKPIDKAIEASKEQQQVEKVQVEYVDPNTQDSKERLLEMEADLEKKINGKGDA